MDISGIDFKALAEMVERRTKARVESLIKDVLDVLPDVYDDNIWPKACEEVYLHVIDKYAGEGVSDH